MSEIPKEEKEEPKSEQNLENPAPTPEEPKEEKNQEEEDKKEVKQEEDKKEEKEEIPENKEEKELSANEEDKKEIYDAIKDLKPEEVSDNVKSKLLSLSNVHFDFQKIKDDQYGVEYDSLTDQYDKKFLELDEKIDSIVTTKEKEKIEITQDEKEKYGITDDDAEVKEIEDYWEKVIINSRYFTITDKDKIILKYLHKVKMVKFPGNNNHNINDFRIDFYFKENEFFSNEILSKTYIYQKDATLKKAEGTKIEWKSPDKNKFLTDEVTFFRDDLFVNQLEYYLDIVSKTKNGDFDDGEDYDDGYDDGYNNNYDNNNYDKYDKGKKGGKYGGNGGNDGKKEECKNQ